jgi:hypothetical protein
MPTLTEEIDTTMQAIVDKLQTLIATGSVTDLTLAAKALEAVRGTSSLQNILAQSQEALATLSGDLAAAQAALTSGKDGHLVTMVNLKNTLAQELNTLQDQIQAAYLAGAATIGVPRVGDIFLGIYPDPNLLPDDVSICDGRYIPTVNAGLIINVWGLGNGQTPCTMIANYNASVAINERAIVDGNGLRLPNFSGTFFKAANPANVGQYQLDDVKQHNHGAVQPLVVSTAGTGTGVNRVANASFRLDTAATTSDFGGETRPKNFSALALVRYK